MFFRTVEPERPLADLFSELCIVCLARSQRQRCCSLSWLTSLLSFRRLSKFKFATTIWFCWSTRYEIRAASSVSCVFVPQNLNEVISEKAQNSKGLVGLFSFYLLQRVVVRLVSMSACADSNGCWRRRRVDLVIADSILCFLMLMVSLAAADSPTRWLEAAWCALDSPFPCSVLDGSTRISVSSRWQSRLTLGSCLPQPYPIACRPWRSCATQ